MGPTQKSSAEPTIPLVGRDAEPSGTQNMGTHTVESLKTKVPTGALSGRQRLGLAIASVAAFILTGGLASLALFSKTVRKTVQEAFFGKKVVLQHSLSCGSAISTPPCSVIQRVGQKIVKPPKPQNVANMPSTPVSLAQQIGDPEEIGRSFDTLDPKDLARVYPTTPVAVKKGDSYFYHTFLRMVDENKVLILTKDGEETRDKKDCYLLKRDVTFIAPKPTAKAVPEPGTILRFAKDAPK